MRRVILRWRRSRGWDRKWQTLQLREGWRQNEAAPEVRASLEYGWLKPGMTILEVGCGSGENAAWLASQGCNVTRRGLVPGGGDHPSRRAVRGHPEPVVLGRGRHRPTSPPCRSVRRRAGSRLPPWASIDSHWCVRRQHPPLEQTGFVVRTHHATRAGRDRACAPPAGCRTVLLGLCHGRRTSGRYGSGSSTSAARRADVPPAESRSERRLTAYLLVGEWGWPPRGRALDEDQLDVDEAVALIKPAHHDFAVRDLAGLPRATDLRAPGRGGCSPVRAGLIARWWFRCRCCWQCSDRTRWRSPRPCWS